LIIGREQAQDERRDRNGIRRGLCHDPAFRLFGSEKVWDWGAALTSLPVCTKSFRRLHA
jgi:hypothetical protein